MFARIALKSRYPYLILPFKTADVLIGNAERIREVIRDSLPEDEELVRRIKEKIVIITDGAEGTTKIQLPRSVLEWYIDGTYILSLVHGKFGGDICIAIYSVEPMKAKDIVKYMVSKGLIYDSDAEAIYGEGDELEDAPLNLLNLAVAIAKSGSSVKISAIRAGVTKPMRLVISVDGEKDRVLAVEPAAITIDPSSMVGVVKTSTTSTASSRDEAITIGTLVVDWGRRVLISFYATYPDIHVVAVSI